MAKEDKDKMIFPEDGTKTTDDTQWVKSGPNWEIHLLGLHFA